MQFMCVFSMCCMCVCSLCVYLVCVACVCSLCVYVVFIVGVSIGYIIVFLCVCNR